MYIAKSDSVMLWELEKSAIDLIVFLRQLGCYTEPNWSKVKYRIYAHNYFFRKYSDN